ncbi:hypothetical protein [Archangium sp.]|uniref:hypothetical protein n=1 Tax=Archangium sp. TaxID=1872627 RepID=UPI002D48E950|nr:hypothetical protein [Archangium sp.]HYO54351.1 hypothetical protein [Archangium sp.]
MREEKNRGGRAGGPSTPQEKSEKGGRNEQEQTPARVQQMMTRLGLTFEEVKDPRARRGQRYPLGAMLLVQALAVGCRVLRRAERWGRTWYARAAPLRD